MPFGYVFASGLQSRWVYKNRLAKVFKNAAMQDDRQNLELYKSK